MKKYTILYLIALLLWPVTLWGQAISAPNTTIDCGEVMFRQPVTAEFKLRNSGSLPLVIHQVRTSCGCTKVTYPSAPIPVGESFTVTAVYDSKQLGHFLKQIGIYSNAADSPTMLTLRGQVVAKITGYQGEYLYKLGALDVDQTDIEFDNVNRGDKPIQEIHLLNNGTEVVEPVVMHLPDWLRASVVPRKIAPGHKGKVLIQLDSQGLRDLGLVQTSLYLGMFPGDKVSPENEIPVSAVLLPDFENLTEEQRADAPKMRLSEASLELGGFNGKSKKGGTILVENQGHSPLIIRQLQMFTAGLQVSLNKSQIMPGETAKLKITAIAEGIRRLHSKPRVLMITNDPENTKVVINVNVD